MFHLPAILKVNLTVIAGGHQLGLCAWSQGSRATCTDTSRVGIHTLAGDGVACLWQTRETKVPS